MKRLTTSLFAALLIAAAASGARAVTHDVNLTDGLVLACVRQTMELPNIDTRDLRSILGVSHRQALLDHALLSGQSLFDYANKHQVQISTARWHLQRLFRHLRCNSQPELIRQLSVVML